MSNVIAIPSLLWFRAAYSSSIERVTTLHTDTLSFINSPSVDASQVRRDSLNTDYSCLCNWMVRSLKGKNGNVMICHPRLLLVQWSL